MALNDIFKSTEELVLDVALWPFFAFKTFCWTAIVPWKLHSYVLGEQEKDTAKRYDARMSPSLCWFPPHIQNRPRNLVNLCLQRPFEFLHDSLAPVKHKHEVNQRG